MIRILLALLWICGTALAVTDSFTITGNVEAPGPSATLFNSPYYTCTTNRYISTTGNDSNTGTASDNAHAWKTLAHADSATPSAGWCINVLPGTYAAGTNVTHGGSTASSTGYVVYRCTTLDGCTITDSGSNDLNGAITFEANYVIIDGFALNAASPQGANTNGFVTCNTSGGPCTGSNTIGNHHIWLINNSVTGYGQSGVQLNNGEYFYTIHNTIFQNSHDCQAAQGPGVSYFLPVAIPAYSPTADDQNNIVTGNTGTMFRQFIMWNVIYNNYVGCTGTANTDGNGIIADDWRGDQFSSPTGSPVYVNGGLIAFNVSYNNGGGGVHVFTSAYITVANNSDYNDFLDTHNSGTFRGTTDDDGSYGINYINNLSSSVCGSGVLASNSAMGVYGLDSGTNPTFHTTLGAAITTTGQTSITVTSATNMPGGATWGTAANFLLFSGSYALPGGNMIQIDSEQMQVTAGWGTTTLTVLRGQLGTAAATHSNGATVQWMQEYYANNITHVTGACTEIDQEGSGDNLFYSSTANKQATLPGWSNVGNTSTGSKSTQPNGTNFALAGGSAAVGYGKSFSWLSAQSADAGACWHSLTTCP